MEAKSSRLTSKLNVFLNKGATIAKESLSFLNKQITDIQTNLQIDVKDLNDEGNNKSNPFGLSNYASLLFPSLPNDDPILSALANNQVPVFYYFQPSSCPTQCTTCHPIASSSLHGEPSPQATKSSSSEDIHLFFLPSSGASVDQLTVQQLKQLLPPSITTVSSKQSIHLRFKVAPPVEDQDLFPDYIWLDVDDEMSLASYAGFIYIRILPLPIPAHRPYLSKRTSRRQSSDRSQSHQSPPLPSPALTSNDGWDSDKRVDLLGPSSTSQSSSVQPSSLHRPDPRSLSPPLDPIGSANSGQHTFPLDRDALRLQRESKQGSRIQDLVNEHIARREKELATAEARQNASLELREELDQWALTINGTYKDLRALLSSLPEVLWENHQWTPVSLSELLVMKPNEFRKVYRTALLLSHPDKHQTSSPQCQFRAQRIFQALNESFKSMS